MRLAWKPELHQAYKPDLYVWFYVQNLVRNLLSSNIKVVGGYLKDGFQQLLLSTQTHTMEWPNWVILVCNHHQYKHGTEKYISKNSDWKQSWQNMNHLSGRSKTQSPHHNSPCMSRTSLPWYQVAWIFFSIRCFIGAGGEFPSLNT